MAERDKQEESEKDRKRRNVGGSERGKKTLREGGKYGRELRPTLRRKFGVFFYRKFLTI